MPFITGPAKVLYLYKQVMQTSVNTDPHMWERKKLLIWEEAEHHARGWGLHMPDTCVGRLTSNCGAGILSSLPTSWQTTPGCIYAVMEF